MCLKIKLIRERWNNQRWRGGELIPSVKRAFQKAGEDLQNSENHLRDINAQIKALQKEKQATEERIEGQKQNYVNKGLQYYSEGKRKELLKKAEDHCYSANTIARLRELSEEKWNQDQVDYNTIMDMKSMEAFVDDNMAGWETNPLTSLGKFFNGN